MENYIFQGDIENSKRILYTPSSFARNTLIHLQEIGCLQSIKPHTNKRNNLESYLFFIVESGSGTLNYGGSKYSLHSGDCVFIDCRLEYSHSTCNDLWKLKWVHFNGPNMQQIYIKYKERGGSACFHPKDIIRYDNILSEINASADSSSYVKDMLIFQKLTCLLTYLMEDSWQEIEHNKTTAKYQTLQHVREYLEKNYVKQISLDYLAEYFFINKFYLTRIFKEQYGITINNYIQQIRITQAKHLIRFTDMPMEKICLQCGFSDASYFSRIFKKIEGCSPNEYRKMW